MIPHPPVERKREHHIDYEVFNVLNVFSKATTIVYGE